VELRLGRHGVHVHRADAARVVDEGVEQCLSGDGVDLARNAVRQAMDHAARIRREQLVRVAACDRNAMMDVTLGLHVGERMQTIVDRDSLSQLTQLLARQLHLELGLSDEEDLQQLLAADFLVRQQPNLLEQSVVEILCLVEQQDRHLAAAAHGLQVTLELHERHRLRRAAGSPTPKRRQISSISSLRVSAEFVIMRRARASPTRQRVVDRGRFARADFARDQDERLAVLDPVAQVGERFLMSLLG
jgi:hypothetical protein